MQCNAICHNVNIKEGYESINLTAEILYACGPWIWFFYCPTFCLLLCYEVNHSFGCGLIYWWVHEGLPRCLIYVRERTRNPG